MVETVTPLSEETTAIYAALEAGNKSWIPAAGDAAGARALPACEARGAAAVAASGAALDALRAGKAQDRRARLPRTLQEARPRPLLPAPFAAARLPPALPRLFAPPISSAWPAPFHPDSLAGFTVLHPASFLASLQKSGLPTIAVAGFCRGVSGLHQPEELNIGVNTGLRKKFSAQPFEYKEQFEGGAV